MPLKIFNSETAPTAFGGRSKEPGFSVYWKNGQIIFNASACELLQLSVNDELEFAQDEENDKLWFISKVKQKGYALRKGKKEIGLRFANVILAKAILNSAKMPEGKGGRIKIREKQVKIEGKTLWPLDLSLLKSK